jgi:hypothetical protein
MNNFKKIILPGKTQYGRIYIAVKYNDGELSMTGVVGAKSNGNCYGAGQINNELLAESFIPAPKWNKQMVEMLYDVWEKWHLNYLTAHCEHQEALGWAEKAKEDLTLYHWVMTDDAMTEREIAEQAAVKALRTGETFTPTPEQTFYANLEYTIKTETPELPASLKDYYEKHKEHTETKKAGYTYKAEHSGGVLNEPCPECGYRYGSAWLTKEVPNAVIDWLEGLPENSGCPWKNL